MGFLKEGVLKRPLKQEPKTEWRAGQYGLYQTQTQPKRNEEAIDKMARTSAQNNSGMADVNILKHYSRSPETFGECSKTAYQKIVELGASCIIQT